MKRCVFGTVLLLSLLLLAVFIGWGAEKALDPIVLSLSAAREAASAEDWAEARVHTLQARESWDNRKKFLSALSDHGLLEEAEGYLIQLESSVEIREYGDFSILCAQLLHRLEILADSHRGTWWNILAAGS